MSESPSSDQRNKRRKIDKHGRFAALERLKNLKGSKHKYELDEVDNVYNTVDEAEYAKTIQQRLDDDWIEDDGGSGFGYVENGREIFDDDELEQEATSSKIKNKKNTSKKRPRDNDTPVVEKKSLKNYFKAGAPTKVGIDDDDILSDILGEINSSTQSTNEVKVVKSEVTIKPKKIPQKSIALKENSEEEMQKYMENFGRSLKKSEKPAKDDSDEEILDRVLKQNSTENKKPTIKPIKTIIKSEPQSQTVSQIVEEPDDVHDLSSIQDEFLNDDFDLKEEIPASVVTLSPLKPKIEKTEDVILKEKENEMQKINLLSGWESICDMEFQTDFDEANLNDTPIENSETMKIWFCDAWSDPNKYPGELFVFGKVAAGGNSKDYKSVCLHVENVDKVMYLLPRDNVFDIATNSATEEKVSMLDVYNEFCNDLSTKLNITKYKTRQVTKNYAYTRELSGGLQVPAICEYLEVRYSAKLPSPTLDKPFRTIAHIFGITSNVIENFLLERKIKGPSWLEIANFKLNTTSSSWCKVQITVPSIKSITVCNDLTPPPPLVICTLNIRSALNEKTSRNEIIMISALVNTKFYINKPAPNPPFSRHFCGVTRMQNKGWPFDFNPANYKNTTVTKCDSERALLSWFLATYSQIDPDLIVTHDSYNYQLDLICNRLVSMKIPMWSRIGRLKMNTPSFSKKTDDFFIGRMICDVKISAEELIKSRSYDLNTLCVEILKIKDGERKDVNLDDIPDMYNKTESLFMLISLTMQDNFYIMRLMCELNVIPLALQITQIAGNLMNRTLHGGRAERNEFLLLHAFSEKDYILPDKLVRKPNENFENRKPKQKAAYAGGLVLDPIKGFYDKMVLLMDFNSLYPSIIQEYNICFTTVLPSKGDDEAPILVKTDEVGILPRQIRKLVESRRSVKQMMIKPGLEPDLKMQYNIRQMALKLTANSLYGCLGFSQSRFYAQHLASMITQKGREILMNTKSIVEKMDYQVIYGDTDSIMINTNSVDYDQVYKIGNNIKQIVNKTYKCLELDVDGIYKYLLLLKKKKYAAVTITKQNDEYICNQELKGLDIVRRDWSKVSVMAGNEVLKELLTDDRPMDERIDNIHTLLENIKDKLIGGKMGLQFLEITKQLTKNLKEYSERNLPHVSVAQRMNRERNRNFKKNDMVNYIICKDGTTEAAMKRAYHIDEVRDEKNKERLQVDIEYYLAQQIHPVVFRLCEPIEGTDAHRLALCLGIDPKKYASHGPRTPMVGEDGEGECMIKTNAQKYRYCHKFEFKCIACQTQNPVAAGFRRETSLKSVFQQCDNEKCKVLPQQYFPAIRNQLILAIRHDIKRFYEHWMCCDNPSCNNNTREYSQVTIKNNPYCIKCKSGLLVLQYSESDLYTQLNYYSYMFDLQKYDLKMYKMAPEIKNMYTKLKETVDRFLQKSKYATVKLSSLYLNYMLNPNSQKKKIYPVRECHGSKANDIKWSDYINYQ